MKTESIPFFLFLGGSDHEGATSKLKAAGCEYKKKFLESRLENWESIFEYLRAENLYGVLVKLINTTYELMASWSTQRQRSDCFLPSNTCHTSSLFMNLSLPG